MGKVPSPRSGTRQKGLPITLSAPLTLYTRNGYDFADRFLRTVEAIKSSPMQSCFIDGEAIVVS